MALQTNDVGLLFAAFEKAYGHQWKQDKDALPLWQGAMKAFTPRDLVLATKKAIEVHADYPPTLGQFINVLKSNRPMSQQPRIEGPKISDTMALANRVMLKVIVNSGGGVRKITLRAMITLKNSLAHDFEGMDDETFPAKLDKELTELMEGYEQEAQSA